jgi:hypothetical protein
MSPSVAGGFARKGWGKKEIRRHLFENTKIPAGWIERYSLAITGNSYKISDMGTRAAILPAYLESDDPNRLVPWLLREEWTDLVVAGDPGRNQSKIYINNQEQGAPVSRRVEMPRDWKSRLG